MARYFGIDVLETIAGRGKAPSVVLMHERALPGASATRALQRGGWEFYEFDQSSHLLADIYDAVMQNTAWTGQWKRPPSFAPWPRPEKKKEKKKVTVRSLFAKYAGKAH